MLSAHWEAKPFTLGATSTVPLVYDFYGFPERYYQQPYAAPGAPGVASRLHSLGSGFITHNLRFVDWDNKYPTPQWAAEFDQWTAEALFNKDVDALLQYREKAPGVRTALPTHEHFAPLLVALGASLDDPPPTFPIEGFWMGSLTRRSVQFG